MLSESAMPDCIFSIIHVAWYHIQADLATPVGASAAAAAQQQQTKPASAAATQPRRPSRADQNKVLNKELLDADMDIYKQSHTGGDTSELEKKLESLQSQVQLSAVWIV